MLAMEAKGQVAVVIAIRMRTGCSLQKFNLRKMIPSVADSRGLADLSTVYRTTLTPCIAVDSAMNREVETR